MEPLDSLFPSKAVRHAAGRALSALLRDALPMRCIPYDRFGFVTTNLVLNEMRSLGHPLSVQQLEEIVNKDPQRRFEMKRNHIRARAGHKFQVFNPSAPVVPPLLLYHGTAPSSVEGIMEKGILKMGKAYVHLTDTIERAIRIGLRKSPKPTILCIRALEAHKDGFRFWLSGQISSDGAIFLSDEIPPTYIVRVAKGSQKHR